MIANQRIRAYVPGPAAGYAIGTGSIGVLWMQGTGVVTSLGAGSATVTAAQFGGGIVVFAAGASQTLTLDTAANMLLYANNNTAGFQIGDIMQCVFINGSGTNSFTIAAGSGGTSDPNQATITVPANTSKNVMVRFTAVGTSPSYVVYA
jgi:hypothetical protein